MTDRVLVECCQGLGDNIYSRPFVRQLTKRFAQVWLETPWPELFEDLPVRFIRPEHNLRTQAENVERQPDRFTARRKVAADRVLRLSYHPDMVLPIVTALERAVPLDAPPVWDLPEWPDAKDEPPLPGIWRGAEMSGRPIAVIRPATLRMEWPNAARNPLPEYVEAIASELCKTHVVVALAHLHGRHELALSIPPHHVPYLHGELGVRQVLSLVRAADVVVGGVGWIVPAAIALKRKAFIIRGGQGGQNAPEIITDPRMDLSRIGWATPDQVCGCKDPRHECPKTISDLPSQWEAWCSAQGLAARQAPR